MSEPHPNVLQTRTHRWTKNALAAIVVTYIAFNATIESFFHTQVEHDRILAFGLGVFVFEPMSFALWTALGFGAIMTRLPLALAALGIVVVADARRVSGMGELERMDFIALILGAATVFVLSTLLFLGLRWFSGRRFEPISRGERVYRPTVSFSLKYLLLLTAMAAVALGIASQLRFREPPRMQILGADFVLYVMIVGGAIIAAISLPMIAVPLFVLSPHISKRAFLFAAGFWFVVAFVSSLMWALNEEGPWPELVVTILLTQLGAGVAGALTAAPLRLAGLRWVKSPLKSPQAERGSRQTCS